MKHNIVVVDGSLGDSGKARVIDYLAQEARVVVRFNGSGNAGHTVYHNGKKYVFHIVPAGVLYPHIVNVIATGVMIDPIALVDEIKALRAEGVRIEPDNLKISGHSSVITELHRIIDNYEEDRSNNRIGTTRRGVGPGVVDKVGRRGLRMEHLLNNDKIWEGLGSWEDFRDIATKYRLANDYHYDIGRHLIEAGEFLRPFITDTSLYLHKAVNNPETKHQILFEGAQGPLLDIDHGSYPFVTSTNCVSASAAVGSGIGPQHLDKVVAVVKAYATRVAAGPFPTEMPIDVADRLREHAGEFGSTTKRKRRIGWLDLPALKYGIRVNGVDSIAITRLDTLSEFGDLKVCSHYTINGKSYEELPLDHLDLFDAVPNYIGLNGWGGDISGAETFEALPKAAQEYVEFVSDFVKVPVNYVSVGPNREQMIVRNV